jgi:hypothetical protein
MALHVGKQNVEEQKQRRQPETERKKVRLECLSNELDVLGGVAKGW